MADNDTAKTTQVMGELLDYQVDAIVAASVAMTNDLTTRCVSAGIPIVAFNRGQDDPRLSEVTSDNVAGGRRAAEFLVEGGHRRIAHIAGWQGSSTGRDRAEGFRYALAQAGQEAVAVIDGLYDRATAARAALDVVAGHQRPDAIFVGNDHMAFGVMDALRFEAGLRIPEDVSVVGYDDVPIASWPAYDLTTIQQPLDAMVAATVSALMAQIEGEQNPHKVRLQGPLVVRGSARRP
jgi:DNA-binding LacI/PurR family transcriptional regulator